MFHTEFLAIFLMCFCIKFCNFTPNCLLYVVAMLCVLLIEKLLTKLHILWRCTSTQYFRTLDYMALCVSCLTSSCGCYVGIVNGRQLESTEALPSGVMVFVTHFLEIH